MTGLIDGLDGATGGYLRRFLTSAVNAVNKLIDAVNELLDTVVKNVNATVGDVLTAVNEIVDNAQNTLGKQFGCGNNPE